MQERWGVAGGDAHKHLITFAVVSSTGEEIDVATFDVTPDGVDAAIEWFATRDVRIDRIGIEGSRSWGLPVAQLLIHAGPDVREVNPARTSDRRRRRRRQKTDREDALAVAIEVLAEENLPPAVSATLLSEAHTEIPAVCDRRRSLIRRRQRLLNEAEGVFTKLPLTLREQLPRAGVGARLRALRRLDHADPDELVVWLLEMLDDLLDWESLIA